MLLKFTEHYRPKHINIGDCVCALSQYMAILDLIIVR